MIEVYCLGAFHGLAQAAQNNDSDIIGQRNMWLWEAIVRKTQQKDSLLILEARQPAPFSTPKEQKRDRQTKQEREREREREKQTKKQQQKGHAHTHTSIFTSAFCVWMILSFCHSCRHG